MAVKKSELYSSLWASCDALRGGMDASQYKDYILTLLFVKYVSDKYIDHPKPDLIVFRKADDRHPDPEKRVGCSFDDLVALKGTHTIGEEMDKVITRLAEENNLSGIIDNARFNDTLKLGEGGEMVDKLTNLISIFQRPELDFRNNRAEGDDIIGDAYEFLMRKFAIESGKSKGQFYTPAEVSRVLAKVIDIGSCRDTNASVYDPACGSGSLLIRAAHEAPFRIQAFGQEKEVTTAGLATMNTVLHGMAGTPIRPGNTFSNPQFLDEKDPTKLRRFDYIVANPPFSLKNWSDGLLDYGRFQNYHGQPPEKNGDYAWLLHIVKSLKKKGKAAVILPHGVLFRGKAEGAIRKKLVDKGLFKGIIGLPANLFYGTGIPACIIVLDKEFASRRTSIFFVDASRSFAKDGNKNRLRERDIHKIVQTFNEQDEQPGYSCLVALDEIRKNHYNLNISRYIDSREPEPCQNIAAHLHGGIPVEDVDSLSDYWSVFQTLRKKLFSPLRSGFYRLDVSREEMRRAVFEDTDFATYTRVLEKVFADWQREVDPVLRTLDGAGGAVHAVDSTISARLRVRSGAVRPTRLIEYLSDEMMARYEPLPLIDEYDVYQVLLSYWNETMADDVHVVVQDGYGAAREISYEYYTKRVREKGRTVLRQTDRVRDWDGKLIPKAIIIAEYFPRESERIEQMQCALVQTQEALDALLEENAGEDSPLAAYRQENGVVNFHLVEEAAASCRRKALLTADERVLCELVDLAVSARQQEKQLRKQTKELDDMAQQQYATLTAAEQLTLLVERKWYAALHQGIRALYTSISNHLAGYVTELAERYESTLPALDREVAERESDVRAHLERMGYTW